MDNEDIINYYNDCKTDYRFIWFLDILHCMHFGYFEKYNFFLPSAIVRMNDQIIKHTNITEKSIVLDAGCGYAGTALYIAEKKKCHIEAITIVEEQVTTANKVIKKKQLDKYINVTRQDYTNTNFKDNTFDIIYALESVCYANKKTFLKEAYRLLKPNGTLIILDGFNSKEKYEYTKKEIEILRKFNHGWAVDSLETPNFFIEESKKLGFINQKYTNITDKTIKTSKILYLASFPAYIFDFFGRALKLRTKYGKGNVVGARYQYLGMKKKLWEYGMFIATKK